MADHNPNACPSCGTDLASNVVCLQCGYHTKSGRRLKTVFSRDPLDRILLLLWFLFLATICVFLVVATASPYRRRGWPVTNGTVVESKIVKGSRASRRGRRIDCLEPHVEYTFDVGGTNYSSKAIGLIDHADFFGKPKESTRMMEKYYVGALVAVHYNPKNPADAVLETGVPLWIVLVPTVSLVFVVIILAGSLSLIRHGKVRSMSDLTSRWKSEEPL